MNSLTIFSGSSHHQFAEIIKDQLSVELGKIHLSKFSNLETSVDIQESVRKRHIFVIQTGSGKVNDHLMELLIIIHACKIAGAGRITVVIPYFPYARQGKMSYMESEGMLNKWKTFEWRTRARPLASAKLIANMICAAGANHIITMDLHETQIQGFFDIPVENLLAEPVVVQWIRQNVPEWKTNAVIVSLSSSVTSRVTTIADELESSFAIIHNNQKAEGECYANQVNNLTFVGDASGKTVLIFDNIADTCGTLCKAAQKVKEAGALKIYAFATHGILSEPGIQRLNRSAIDLLVVTNTVPQNEHEESCSRLQVIDVSHIFGEAIRRVYNGESVSYMFHHFPEQCLNPM